MCGRYTLRASRQQLADAFDASSCADVPQLLERYNLAPQQDAPIIRHGHHGRAVAMARWGLMPGWTKDSAELKSAPINARADRVAHSPMFRAALHRRRCLVPSTGSYDRQRQTQRGPKQPYYIRPNDERLCAFAGLWERWHDEASEALETFTALTTDANELVKPLHDRMPVILSADAWSMWLAPELHDAATLKDLLKTPSDEGWDAVPVSRRVNKPVNDDPACIEPIQLATERGHKPHASDQQSRLF